jgi:hypothetical protein
MTRVLTTAEEADVAAERNRHAWNLPRQPASATSVPDVLDWHAFRSLHFPERRRHDLEALTAYGKYRSARGGTS